MKKNKTIIINLFGAPGAGKSTTAAFLFGELKSIGLNVELVTEYVKDLVWENRLEELSNQIICFGEQLRRIERLNNKVDIIVTDSPLLLNAYYNRDNYINLAPLVVEINERYNNVNFFIERAFEYDSKGRVHSEQESQKIDSDLKLLLQQLNIDYTIIKGDVNSRYEILNHLKNNEDYKVLLSSSQKPTVAPDVVQSVDVIDDDFDGLRLMDVKYDDMSNGDGLRTVVFVSGCEHHCKGCHNPETWDVNNGRKFTKEDLNNILNSLENKHIKGITFSGGDPLLPKNRKGIEKIIKIIRNKFNDSKNIWLYTGYDYEQVKDEPIIKNKLIDVLVDGKFILEQKVLDEFRGSSNQRIIKIKEL